MRGLMLLALSMTPSATAGQAVDSTVSWNLPGVDAPNWLDDKQLRITPTILVPPSDESVPPPGSVHPVRSLVSEEFADLEFLVDRLNTKTLVHLGESSHGVAEYNHLKVRLVKFLHQRLGFSTIALEAPMWGCWDVGRRAEELSAQELMRSCVHPVWQTQEILELFRYIKEVQGSSQPLHLIGFDNQAAPRVGRGHWLASILNPLLPGPGSEVARVDSIFLAEYRVGRGQGIAADSGEAFAGVYQRAAEALAGLSAPTPDQRFALRVLRTAISHLEQLRTRADRAVSTAVRDSAMANNLEFIVRERLAGHKVVTWGHDSHLRRANSSVSRAETGERLPVSVGEILEDRLGVGTSYTIGFYMATGEFSLVNRRRFPVRPLSSKHAEALMMQAGYRYAFFDLRNGGDRAWPQREVLFKWEGTADILMVPSRQFNALIYIHEAHGPIY